MLATLKDSMMSSLACAYGDFADGPKVWHKDVIEDELMIRLLGIYAYDKYKFMGDEIETRLHAISKSVR